METWINKILHGGQVPLQGFFCLIFLSALENAFGLFRDERRMEKGRQEGRLDEAGRQT